MKAPIKLHSIFKLALLLLFLSFSFATRATLYSAANYVELNNGEIRPFIGNGFLLRHNSNTYAITAKHVLFELRSPHVTHIDITKAVKSWHLKPFNSDKRGIKLGRLLNVDATEKLDMEVLKHDYLVFEVPPQETDLVPIELSAEPLIADETLTAFGCSYAVQSECRQNTYSGRFLTGEAHNLRIRLRDAEPETLRGLSGGPVLNAHQQLVGLVSNVLPAKYGNGMDFAPANLNYLHEVLKRLN